VPGGSTSGIAGKLIAISLKKNGVRKEKKRSRYFLRKRGGLLGEGELNSEISAKHASPKNGKSDEKLTQRAQSARAEKRRPSLGKRNSVASVATKFSAGRKKGRGSKSFQRTHAEEERRLGS